mmetsp:Transcript_65/g.195  ORF Transcript_65/g.195 Transcript_65/m.195 type:complete len:203 (+) Transcript_65:198-806(+)
MIGPVRGGGGWRSSFSVTMRAAGLCQSTVGMPSSLSRSSLVVLSLGTRAAAKSHSEGRKACGTSSGRSGTVRDGGRRSRSSSSPSGMSHRSSSSRSSPICFRKAKLSSTSPSKGRKARFFPGFVSDGIPLILTSTASSSMSKVGGSSSGTVVAPLTFRSKSPCLFSDAHAIWHSAFRPKLQGPSATSAIAIYSSASRGRGCP